MLYKLQKTIFQTILFKNGGLMKTTKILKWLPMLALAAIMAAGCGDECEPCKPTGETYPQNVEYQRYWGYKIHGINMHKLDSILGIDGKFSYVINSQKEYEEKLTDGVPKVEMIDFDKHTLLVHNFIAQRFVKNVEEKIIKTSATEYEYNILMHVSPGLAAVDYFHYFALVDKIADSCTVKFNIEETIK